MAAAARPNSQYTDEAYYGPLSKYGLGYLILAGSQIITPSLINYSSMINLDYQSRRLVSALAGLQKATSQNRINLLIVTGLRKQLAKLAGDDTKTDEYDIVSKTQQMWKRMTREQYQAFVKLNKTELRDLAYQEMIHLAANTIGLKDLRDTGEPSKELLEALSKGEINNLSNLLINDWGEDSEKITDDLLNILSALIKGDIKIDRFVFVADEFSGSRELSEGERVEMISLIQRLKVRQLVIHLDNDQILIAILEGVRTNSYIEKLDLFPEIIEYEEEEIIEYYLIDGRKLTEDEAYQEIDEGTLTKADLDIDQMIEEEIPCHIKISKQLEDYLVTFLPGILKDNYTLKQLNIGEKNCSIFERIPRLKALNVPVLLEAKTFPSLKDTLVRMIRKSNLEISRLPGTIREDIFYYKR